MTSTNSSPTPASRPACYRHPGRVSSVVCARCNLPICTDCMIQASVGWQCPQCVHQGAKTSRTIRPFANNGLSGVVGSTNPTPMVIGLIVINVVTFVASGFGKVSVIDRFGGLSHQVIQSDEYYRFLTSMFLHLSFFHIASNMVSLLIVGPAVEVMLGRSRFVALYFLAGLGGSTASYLFAPANSVGAGASGAIFGVMGAYVILAHSRRRPIAPVVALIGINLVIGFTGGIDWRDHLGGLAVGLLLALAYDFALQQRQAARQLALVIGSSAAVLIILAVLVKAIPPGHIFLEFS
jgi:membrane associated rhomboid family serine protease